MDMKIFGILIAGLAVGMVVEHYTGLMGKYLPGGM